MNVFDFQCLSSNFNILLEAGGEPTGSGALSYTASFVDSFSLTDKISYVATYSRSYYDIFSVSDNVTAFIIPPSTEITFNGVLTINGDVHEDENTIGMVLKTNGELWLNQIREW